MFYCCKIFKNTYFEEHLRTATSELILESDCLELCLKLDSRFENHPDLVILQKYDLLSNQRFKPKSAHMWSLYLTPKPRPTFLMFLYKIFCRSLYKKQTLEVLGLLVYALPKLFYSQQNFFSFDLDAINLEILKMS